MNTLKTLCAASAAMVLAGPATAAMLSYDVEFEVTLTDAATAGFLGTVFDGTIAFDDSLLDINGDGVIAGSDLALDFIFDGIAYDETNDIDYDFFPEVEVVDNMLATIDLVIEAGFNGAAFTDPNVFLLTSITDFFFDSSTDTYLADVTLNDVGFGVVPLPAGAPLMLGGLAALGLMSRRRKAN